MERWNCWESLMGQRRKILVIGSNGGLGSRIVSLLNENYQSDFQVISLSRETLQIENTSKIVHFDATDHAANLPIFEYIEENHGPIWAVIDSTGLSRSEKFIKTISFCSYYLF